MADSPPPGEPPAPEALAPLDAADDQPLRQWSQVYDRTWELELLISGAVAFTLLQLPGAIDQGYERLYPKLGEGLGQAMVFGYIYLKIILYALITTFVVHLVARAYWVGLVGLSSVFPEGVKWENTKFHPIAREFYQARIPALQEQSRAVDRFCSVLFSFATIIVLTFVSSTVLVILVAAIAWLASGSVLSGVDDALIFYAIFALLILPVGAATLLDRFRGARATTLERTGVRGVLRVLHFAQFGTATSTITHTLFSNVKRTKSVGLFYLAFAALLVFFFVKDVLFRMGGYSIDAYDALAEEGTPQTVSYVHYEDQRPEGVVFARAPSIQSDIIDGPYVRLFLPFYPRRHNPLIEERCPGLDAAIDVETESDRQAERTRTRELLECLAGLQPVTLNGRALDDAGWHYYTRPGDGIRGIIAYLPTAGLPAGENELRIGVLPRSAAAARDREELAPEPYHIPFWVVPLRPAQP